MYDDMREYLEEGRRTEEFVMSITKQKLGGSVSKATRLEDIKAHVDFWWNKDDMEMVGVDVKGLHKENRKDEDYTEDYFWLEYFNVKGEAGWLFGKSRYIAFLLKNEILYVPTQRLRDFALGVVKAGRPFDGRPYTLKTREGRMDLIVKVERACIEYFAEFKVELDTRYYR